jgi:hypothetical protein
MLATALLGAYVALYYATYYVVVRRLHQRWFR